ncbi:MAG: SMC-Scp complex subunit ScpB, partial [Lachnospiraceae bacterium]|nr:SMC-Scp complex subunit ScpB [Lachnospiraceae bacterium]
MERKELCAIVEGILFTMGDSVNPEKIANALEIEKDEVVSILDELAETYEKEERGIRITKLDGSYQMCTPPAIYEYLIKIAKQPKRYSLTDTLLETLSI